MGDRNTRKCICEATLDCKRHSGLQETSHLEGAFGGPGKSLLDGQELPGCPFVAFTLSLACGFSRFNRSSDFSPKVLALEISTVLLIP